MGIRVPHPLFDTLMQQYNLKNDAALSRLLQLPPPDVSRIRNGHRPVSATILLQIHEMTGWPVKNIKELLK